MLHLMPFWCYRKCNPHTYNVIQMILHKYFIITPDVNLTAKPLYEGNDISTCDLQFLKISDIVIF